MLLHRAIKNIADGHWIMLISTDPASVRDIAHFCRFLHHHLLQQHQWQQNKRNYYAYLIEKGEGETQPTSP